MKTKIKKGDKIGIKDIKGKDICVGDFLKYKGYRPDYPERIVWHEGEKEFVLADSNDDMYFTRLNKLRKMEIFVPKQKN